MPGKEKALPREAASPQPDDAATFSLLKRPGVVGLLLAILTFAAYSPVVRNDFVNYDDSDYVFGNAHVYTGLKWENIVWAFNSGHASNWHPITWMSHQLDCQLFGVSPLATHLVNLLIHAGNAVLLFFLLRRMTGAHWRGALVAALFALHPLHVESVAWASERKDVLSTLFFLLTLYCYAEYASKAASSNQRPAILAYGLALLCFVLGLLSKPMLVTLPFVLLLLDYWPLNRIRPPLLGRLLIEKIPFFSLSAASCVVTFYAQKQGGAVSTSISLGARLANASVSCARYLIKTIFPFDLSVLYPHPGSWKPWIVAAATVVVVAILVSAGLAFRRRPYWTIGWLWFFGTLVPVIGFVQVGIQSMADRYTYIPLMGVFIAVVWLVADLMPKEKESFAPIAVGAAFILLVCVGLTWRQVQYWRDSETLFKRAVAVTTGNYLAYNNIGFYQFGKGRTDEAMDSYRKALEIKPDYEDALNNLGHAFAGRKDFVHAIPLYEAALRIRPNHIEVHNNYGNALSEVGQLEAAITNYQFVLAHQPDHADAHNNLGIAFAMQGKLDDALPHFQAAIRLKKEYASAHSNLGNVYAAKHQLDQAVAELELALKLSPEDAQAHNNLGNVLAEQGKLDEAVPHYEKALKLNANNPEAHYNLALAYVRLGKKDPAISHLQDALRIKPDYTQARQQLEALNAGTRP